MAFGGKKPRFLKRQNFSAGERSTAASKMESLKNARAVLQPLAVSMEKISRENRAVFKAMLRRKKVTRSLSRLVSQSLMLSENLRAASQGRKVKNDITAIEEGKLLTEIKVAVSVIGEARKKGMI